MHQPGHQSLTIPNRDLLFAIRGGQLGDKHVEIGFAKGYRQVDLGAPKFGMFMGDDSAQAPEAALRHRNRGSFGSGRNRAVRHDTEPRRQSLGDKGLVEVQQAGVFTIRGFAAEHLPAILATVCPNTLFPFAREAICDVVIKGGFPQLLLAPVNFEMLYAQELRRRQGGSAAPAH